MMGCTHVPCLFLLSLFFDTPLNRFVYSFSRRQRCCEKTSSLLHSSVPCGSRSRKTNFKGMQHPETGDLRFRCRRDRRMINYPSTLRCLFSELFRFPFFSYCLTATGLSYTSSSNVCWMCIISYQIASCARSS